MMQFGLQHSAAHFMHNSLKRFHAFFPPSLVIDINISLELEFIASPVNPVRIRHNYTIPLYQILFDVGRKWQDLMNSILQVLSH